MQYASTQANTSRAHVKPTVHYGRTNVLLLKTFDLLNFHCLTYSAVSDRHPDPQIGPQVYLGSDKNMKKIFGGMWWKGVWGVMAVWVEQRIEDHQEFHHPTTFSNVIMEQTSPSPNTMMLMHRLKAGDEVYLGRRTHRGAPPWNWWDIKWGAGLWYLGCQGGAPLILGILGWHGRDIGAGAAGCLWYPAGTNRGRKQGAKAHFSLSRFGDYPISLTLTSLTGPGEFNTIPFRRIEKNKTTSSIDWVVTFLQRLQHPVKASMVVILSDKWFSDFFFRLKAPPIYITLCYCKHHAIRMMHCVTSFCNKLLVCVTNGM